MNTDPTLLIIKYIFDKHNITNNDDTIQSFFDNGVAFPKLIELAFNEEIPGIHKHPKTSHQRIENNEKARKILFSKNKEIGAGKPNFNTEQERQELLKMIITRQFFKIDMNDILFEVNLILSPLQIKYFDPEDMIEYECLANLLKELTKGQIIFDINSLDFPAITNILHKSKVPVVINESSLQKNRYSFFIQIKIIFDIYSSEKSKIIDSSKDDDDIKSDSSTERIKTIHRLKALPIIEFSRNIDSIDDPNSENEKLNENENDDIINAAIAEFQQSIRNKKEEGKKKPRLIDSGIKKREKINKINKCMRKSMKLSNDDTNGFILLMIIQKVGSVSGYKCENINSIQEIDLPMFVSCLLKEEEDKTYISNICEIKSILQKNEETVKFLSKKFPIFGVLKFDFNSDKSDRKKSAFYSFYIHFLNCFFLKRTKHEYLNLIKKIIVFLKNQRNNSEEKEKFKGIKNYNEYENEILYKWDTYVDLYSFAFQIYDIEHAKSEFENDDDEESFFMVINEKDFQRDDLHIDPNLLYYQVQFFFDVIEERDLLTKINVSKSDNEIEIDEQITKEENKLKSISFSNRLASGSIEEADSSENQDKIESIPSPNEFWDPIDDSHIIKNGTIVEKNAAINTVLWDNFVHDYLNNVDHMETKGNLFCSLTSGKNQTKLYRFYYYNENEKKWLRDLDSIEELGSNIKYNEKPIKPKKHKESKEPEEPKFSIVVFTNSDENDVLSMSSQYFKMSNQKPDEDHICVYGFCESKISSFNYEVKMESHNIIPLFLFLHVPESKKEMENIGMIIFRIYFFLSILSDVDVVILNREYYKQQIRTITRINNVKYSFCKSVGPSEGQYNLLLSSGEGKSGNDSSDGDEGIKIIDEDQEESDNENENSLLPNKSNDEVNFVDIFTNINPILFQREKHYILLVNDNIIEGDIKSNEKKNEFFENIYSLIYKDVDHQKDKFFNNEQVHFSTQIHYININNAKTYREFLTSLIKNVMENNGSFEYFIHNTFYIEATQICKKYVDIKSNKTYSDKLKECIDERYNHFLRNTKEKLFAIQTLSKEIVKYYPFIDYSFKDNCDDIITSKISGIVESNINKIEKELIVSSNGYLEYLDEVIKSGTYWDNDTEDSVKKSYVSFVKNEYFDIINFFYRKTELIHAFVLNEQIFDEIIENGLKEIGKKFENFKSKLHDDEKEEANKDEKQKIASVDAAFRKATNYTFREKENIREIKIALDSDNWEKEIEQDF